MSAQHPYIEQDNAPPPGGDDLPTYDDLAAQNGPNSRLDDSYIRTLLLAYIAHRWILN